MYSRLKIFKMMREYDDLSGKQKQDKLNEILIYHLDNDVSASNIQFVNDMLLSYGGYGTIKRIKESELRRAIRLTDEELEDLYGEEDDDLDEED